MTQITERDIYLAALLAKDIDYLGLSVRAYKGLRRFGISTVADLIICREKGNIKNIRNIGEKSAFEIENALEQYLNKNGYSAGILRA